MESLMKYGKLLDTINIKTVHHKSQSKEFFLKTYGEQLGEYLYNITTNSKSGLISVYKVSDNPGIAKGKVYSGVTTGFGEGLGVHISNSDGWFTSSVIQEIDWDKSEFRTLNSTYHFDFMELDESEFNEYLKKLENDSKDKD